MHFLCTSDALLPLQKNVNINPQRKTATFFITKDVFIKKVLTDGTDILFYFLKLLNACDCINPLCYD